MKIRVGDTVVVIAGKDKGKTGEVLQVLAKEERVIVEGVNMVTKHVKPSQADPEGGIVNKEAPIHVSNVAFYDSKSKSAVKLGYKVSVDENGKKTKVRVNKKQVQKLILRKRNN
ncbi:MAG: 50S ribosomal protein L24 [Faecalibacillus faecis]